MTTKFKVYYTNPENDRPHSVTVEQLVIALQYAEEFRKDGMTFVTMVSENTNQVGKAGVDTITNGKTPDGEVYDWSKASRAGKMKRSERTVSALQGTDNVEVKLDDE